MKRLGLLSVALLSTALQAACTGTTGDELLTFPVYAAGAKDADAPFSVNGWTIRLTYAHMYVGALYVNEAPAQNGGTFNTPSCVDEGIYCAQVPAGLDVDLLSSSPQAFPVQGNGSADRGRSFELYMVDGDVNAPENSYVTDVNGTHQARNTADLQGTATRESDGKVFSWFATITINASNRGEPAQEPGQPGLNPICKQRIIELGDIDMLLFSGGRMLLTIDPRQWFRLPIDFSSLPLASSQQCSVDQGSAMGTADYCIPDASNLPGSTLGSQQGSTLFSALSTAGSAGFTLTYATPPGT